MLPRIRKLRTATRHRLNMIQTLAAPLSLYSCETQGVACSKLNSLRSSVARAAAPEAGGKNYVLSTIDPAFAAHADPIKHYAMAFWCAWIPEETLTRVFHAATRKLDSAVGLGWKRCNGPITGYIATCRRLGWHTPSPLDLYDDRSTAISIMMDSPAAITKAVHRSVRRWRFGRILDILPSMVPQGHGDQGTITVDCTPAINTLISGKCTKPRECPVWRPQCSRYLVSAISGGQWTQARKAAVPHWKISDTRCQLCLKECGTLEHRHVCDAIRPHIKWNPVAPSGHTTVFPHPLTARESIMRTRGLLAATVRHSEPTNEWFQWLRKPPPTLDGSETWYTDGSALDTRLPELGAAGFAVVVVARDKSIVAFGHGCPPPLYLSAAAAEAFALDFAINACGYVPKVVTDCRSLLDVIGAGIQPATCHGSPLARAWVSIYNKLGQNTDEIAHNNRITWMPAHLPITAIWNATRSDGKVITPVDWRANRLVDALAKAAAATRQAPSESRDMIKAALGTLRFAGLRLGIVTFWANNLPVQAHGENGSTHTITIRDAVSKNQDRSSRVVREAAPASVRSSAAPTLPRPVEVGRVATVPGTVDSTASGRQPTTARKRAATDVLCHPSRQVGKKRRITMREKSDVARRDSEATLRRVAEIGAALQPAAFSRMDALRARVAAKERLGSAATSASLRAA